MKIELKHWDNFSKDELAAFSKLEERAFGNDDEENQIEWIESADWHMLIWQDELLVGHVEFSERIINIDSTAIKVGCIGGVCTDPSMRGKGLASVLLKKANEYLKTNLDLEYAILLTSNELEAFYNKFGYTIVKTPCLMEQKVGKVNFEDIVMVLPLKDKSWPKGIIDLCGLPW